ncbi:MAG: hypothetical protein WBL61_21895 [Bryobacteraceae bacterium]
MRTKYTSVREPVGNGVLLKPRRLVDPDDVLTPAEAKRLRQSLKQTRQGKTRPWSEIKDELGP